MKKIIFLDFDGVMDTSYYLHVLASHKQPQTDNWGPIFDPDCIENLGYIISETGADIVVSSSWKDSMTYGEMLQMWEDRSLPGFVTDMTPSVSVMRGEEIEEWLKQCRRICRYVIIDDLDTTHFKEEQLSSLLCVNPYDGLTKHIADRAISILNNDDNY